MKYLYYGNFGQRLGKLMQALGKNGCRVALILLFCASVRIQFYHLYAAYKPPDD